ncbi:porin [Dyella humi]|uniref:Porin n=1 Tax=Dyella humi TaxID=1770547 RepID=A0ABW8IED2_9GAMM
MKNAGSRLSIKRAKTCIALLATSVSPGAWAELTYSSQKASVTFYGVVDVAYAYVSNRDGHADNTYMAQSNLLANKLGLSGTYDFNENTQALARAETNLDVRKGKLGAPGVFLNRQAFAGISDKRYGTLTMGRQYTPYFQYVGGQGPANVLTGATGTHPGDIIAMDTTLRLTNAFTYASPKIRDWQGSVQYGLARRIGNGWNGGSLSAAVRYDHEGFAWSAGYVQLNKLATTSAVATFAMNAPINRGYASADNAKLLGTAARYRFGKKMVGLNYANIRYAPGPASLFTDTAVFNSYGIISNYALTPAMTLAAGYSYTAEAACNGLSSLARYQQLSLEQLYVLNEYVALYALQAYQKASGKTLRTIGGVSTIVDATASVGDSQNGMPSSGPSQGVAMLGVRFKF